MCWLTVNKLNIVLEISCCAQVNNLRGVVIGSCPGWRLAFVARRLIEPLIPPQGPLPWEVAKKCHSTLTPISCSWKHVFTKMFLFLYWELAPSEKQIIFFGSLISFFGILANWRWNRWIVFVLYFKLSDMATEFICLSYCFL